MRLVLIDEFRFDLHPYVAGEGTRLFDDLPKSYRLDLVSSTEFSNGIVGSAVPPAPLVTPKVVGSNPDQPLDPEARSRAARHRAGHAHASAAY